MDQLPPQVPQPHASEDFGEISSDTSAAPVRLPSSLHCTVAALLILIALPILYVLSFIPMYYGAHRGYFFTEDDAWYVPLIQVHHRPLAMFDEYGPEWSRKAIDRYLKFLDGL